MGLLSLTDPVNSTTADATLIATNNAAVKAVVNGGIDNTNIVAGAAIATSKLGAFDTLTASRIALGAGADLTLTAAVLTTTGNVHRISATSGGTNLTTINAPDVLDGVLLVLFNATGSSITADSTGNILTPAAGTITVSGHADDWGCLVLVLAPTGFTKYAVVSYF